MGDNPAENPIENVLGLLPPKRAVVSDASEIVKTSVTGLTPSLSLFLFSSVAAKSGVGWFSSIGTRSAPGRRLSPHISNGKHQSNTAPTEQKKTSNAPKQHGTYWPQKRSKIFLGHKGVQTTGTGTTQSF